MAKTARKKRLTRQDWIDAAIDRLIKHGVDAVRIEPLADSIAVSRGSFYWHFKSRRELLTAILETWRQHQTRRIVERIHQNKSLAPLERLVRLRMLPPRTRTSSEAAAFELAVRAWAMRDKLARKAVDRVDDERLKFTTSLLLDAGMPKTEASHWSLMGYAYTLGESLLREVLTDQQIYECRSRFLMAQSHLFDKKLGATEGALRQLVRAAEPRER
ncbi:MAG: TetR/AcrR family transcriptional regulator [Xanthobacteraceae bacterium]|jgi:AcrR family transcriptional regulator|uniref:TetR/AcrR family transcriptional regulator n=1 Tax=Pseudolabrys sp. TaxID=1960880 RepID=UPI003D10C3C1